MRASHLALYSHLVTSHTWFVPFRSDMATQDLTTNSLLTPPRVTPCSSMPVTQLRNFISQSGRFIARQIFIASCFVVFVFGIAGAVGIFAIVCSVGFAL